MKIARFIDSTGRIDHGIVHDDRIVRIQSPPSGCLEDWLGLDSDASQAIWDSAAGARDALPLSVVRLLAPIQRPRKFLALGANYASHLKEVEHLGHKFPDTQIWCNKQTTCINGPADDVLIPECSGQVDYEGELVVVIGRRCRHVSVARAPEVIAGYMVGNDVSVRDVQLRSPTMTLGKSFDSHGPIGPWLVTPGEIPDPHHLRIRTWVNEELRQDGNTSEMRYSIFEQIAELTQVFTLEPGDLIATGTPAGVAAAMRPPRYVQVGDVVRVEIEGVGAIQNRFVAEHSQLLIG